MKVGPPRPARGRGAARHAAGHCAQAVRSRRCRGALTTLASGTSCQGCEQEPGLLCHQLLFQASPPRDQGRRRQGGLHARQGARARPHASAACAPTPKRARLGTKWIGRGARPRVSPLPRPAPGASASPHRGRRVLRLGPSTPSRPRRRFQALSARARRPRRSPCPCSSRRGCRSRTAPTRRRRHSSPPCRRTHLPVVPPAPPSSLVGASRAALPAARGSRGRSARTRAARGDLAL